ncbi:MAG: carboxymuconolactone decarboxylase family protein [Candidatus Tectomicrobia bacterium]|uniref:Carboxymuconolactone decarboxylase family protein n=1 Tax=Tectimicrobiota bacterium TaxID=2528274 RepID=A0A932HV63_UNCTE|nr:carboxymuconolactone decarboxylase family protein [Candidatus Tectomicrobia bacterium]
MARLSMLTYEQMNEAQRRVADEIAAGPRGKVMGPFTVLLRAPEAANRFQKVGEYMRFVTKIPARLRMIAVLTTARAWTAQYEWQVHVPQALSAGVAQETIDALFERRRPAGLKPDEKIVYDFVSELQERGRVSEASFRAALDHFGEQETVELTMLVGYFTAVAMALNVFEVDVPDKTKPPLRD